MQSPLRPFHALRLLALVAAISVWTACSLSTDAPVAQTAAINEGDGQTAPAGTAFPTPLSVIVENIQVVWAIRVGGGSLSATDTRTNAQGISSVTYTAGPTAGIATITATIAGIGTLNFSETIS